MQPRKVIIREAAESDTVGVCRMDVRLRYCIQRVTVTYYFVLYLCQLILPPYTGCVKNWDHIPTSIILSNLNRFKQIFSGRFLSKFVVNNNNNNDRLTAFDPGQPG